MADARLDDPALRALIAGAGGEEGAARLAFWQAATGGRAAPDAAIERRLAVDILSAMDQVPAGDLLAARGSMLSRAASALRGQARGGPGGPGDSAVEVVSVRHPWRGFFGVEALELRHRRYDGTMSDIIRREVYVSTDAVTVLPYDPVRDRVLMVQQFRPAPVSRGGGPVWQTEAVAGRIDPGETPEAAARREAAEEAGLSLRALLPVGQYYPSPGALTEYLYSYVGLADLEDGGLHGLAEEGEDIRAIVCSFDKAMEDLAAGLLATAPLILSLLWLQRERPRLRAGDEG